jgi:hypothetical protein|tara:strand:+ start:550 stop:675 length:126 start_codon:yes stop_codon:yes gene_type:complete
VKKSTYEDAKKAERAARLRLELQVRTGPSLYDRVRAVNAVP